MAETRRISGLLHLLRSSPVRLAEDPRQCRGPDCRQSGSADCRVRGLIGQPVANLIASGLRHTPPGSRISLALDAPPREALITVGDTGPGLPEAERAPVLRRLCRLERSRTTPAHGLGLSLVQAIADLHGARLSPGDNHPGLRVAIRLAVARP
jgi:signal transduction histidine kinase